MRRYVLPLVLIVLVALGAWWFSRPEQPASPVSPAIEHETSQGETPVSALEADATATRKRDESAATPNAMTATDEVPAQATVRARCVDENGRAIAGVRLLRSGNGQPLAQSGADGRIDVTFELGDPQQGTVSLDFVADFHVHYALVRGMRRGETCELGDVLMNFGGRIRGRVVDEEGKPHSMVHLESLRTHTEGPEAGRGTESSKARAAADGSFVLDGVPPGPTLVSARAPGYASVMSERLEVIAGQELTGVVIRLTKRTQELKAGVLVRVLTPTGEPVPEAQLFTQVSHGFGGGQVTTSTDAKGEDFVRCGPDATLVLRAFDSDGRYGAAYAFDVPGNAGTVELRLEEAAPCTLLVVDESGAPVENFAWQLLDQLQYCSHKTGLISKDANGLMRDSLGFATRRNRPSALSKNRGAHAGGRVELHAPKLPFVVQVDAESCALAQAGPFGAGTKPNEIRVALKRLPGIRGRVLAGDSPLAGAWVRLYRAAGGEEVLLVSEFQSRVEAGTLAETTSADDGSFTLPLREAGEFFVLAGRDGLGEAESARLQLAPQSGANGIDLVLLPTGTIEGRFVGGQGDELADRIVGASRGIGAPLSARSDAQGRFRLEGLTPGKWLLRPFDHEVDTRGSSSGGGIGAPDPEQPCNCIVNPGQSTHFEIDLTQHASLGLRVQLAGWDSATWSGYLEPAGGTFGRARECFDKPASEWKVIAEQPGAYDLRVFSKLADPGRSLRIDEHLQLAPGENQWTLAPSAGHLTLANLRGEDVQAMLQSALSASCKASLSLVIPAHSELTLADVPVGTWTRVRMEESQRIEEGRVVVDAQKPARLEWK